LRKLHFGGESGKMRRRDVTVAILDQVQVLNQEIAAALTVAE
jgi:hypothetical protein